MNKNFTKFKQRIAGVTLLTTILISANASAEWSIKTLDGLGGGSNFASAINDLGQVTGSADLPGNTSHAFITGPNGVNTVDLGSLGTGGSFGADINAYGQVAGSFMAADGGHVMITGPDGVGMRDLGTLGGPGGATGINDSGRVVGTSYTADGYAHAFITGPDGEGMIDLGTLEGGGGYPSSAADINNLGQVVGTSAINTNGLQHAFITGPDGVGMTDIGTLPSFWGSLGSGLNASANVIGNLLLSTSEGDFRQAFVTGPNGIGITMLGTLGGNTATPTDINDAGQIVGVSTVESEAYHSFLFVDGGMVDLSVLDVVVSAGWTNIIAVGINNNGQIVGYGNLSDDPSHLHSFLLSFTPDTVFDPNPIFIPELPLLPLPVPEPQTYAMLLAGLGLLGFMAQRRKKFNLS